MGRGRPPKCPFCGASRSIGKGVRRTKLKGERKVRLCRACGRKFTPRYQRPRSPSTDPRPERGEADEPARG